MDMEKKHIKWTDKIEILLRTCHGMRSSYNPKDKIDAYSAFEELDQISMENWFDYIRRLALILADFQGCRTGIPIQAVKEIIRQLSSPSKFIMNIKQQKWIEGDEKIKGEINSLLLTSFINCNINELTRLFSELIVIICNINESQRTFWIDGIWDNLKKGTSSHCIRASFEILGNVLNPNSGKLLCSKTDVFKNSLKVSPGETLEFFTRNLKNCLLSRDDLEIMGNVILESKLRSKYTSDINKCYDFFIEIIRQDRGVLDYLLSHGLSSHIDMVYRFHSKEKDNELSIALDNLIKQIDLI